MKKKMAIKEVDLNDKVLTPAEAGEIFNVSGWAMYKRAKKGQAPSHKIGSRVYLLRSELLAYLQNT